MPKKYAPNRSSMTDRFQNFPFHWYFFLWRRRSLKDIRTKILNMPPNRSIRRAKLKLSYLPRVHIPPDSLSMVYFSSSSIFFENEKNNRKKDKVCQKICTKSLHLISWREHLPIFLNSDGALPTERSTNFILKISSLSYPFIY